MASQRVSIMKAKPAIGITMGDAAGIGPEIIVKSLQDESIYRLCVPVVIGCGAVMRLAGQQFWPQAETRSISSVSQARGQFGTIDVLDMPNLNVKDVALGQVCAASGKAAMEYVIAAMQLAQEGSIQAMVTAPLNKEA
ncbi:MAG: 4-hydroxythreonine-4-phosphate dehydrogenase PdxA, partial [Dehalococcoidales bacterium]|nr:4-hydroxythreonine-4-phosphate dehydrogenase PdxA [Dehalococcoidales bacterium]